MAKVTKAVIAAAGFGTRFLPQTKAMPKEMLPLIDKPIIQYVVEELVAAGISDIIIVGSSNKRAIEDHFDVPNQDLLANLLAGGPGKKPFIDKIEAVANLANFVYLRQKGPYGSATPVANAAHLLGREPFIYTFADDFILAEPKNRFQQMIELHERRGGSVLPCIEATEDSQYDRYGFVGGQLVDKGLIKVERVVEKPGKTQAPSNLASISGFLLEPAVIDFIEKSREGQPAGKEFYIQPAIQMMIDAGHAVYATKIKGGRYFDTGNQLDYLKTVIDFGLNHPELGGELTDYLRQRLG